MGTTRVISNMVLLLLTANAWFLFENKTEDVVFVQARGIAIILRLFNNKQLLSFRRKTPQRKVKRKPKRVCNHLVIQNQVRL